MNTSTEAVSSADKVDSKAHSKSGGAWTTRLGILCAMLVLAIAGIGFTQATDTGAWEYWLFVVLVYAALGLWKSVRSAKQAGQSIHKTIIRELSHWGILVGFLAALLMLERREIINRDSASYFAVMLLALTCCLAGVHIDWLLLVVGISLTLMVLAMAMLEQLSAWIIMILVACVAVAIFYFKSKRDSSAAKATK
ncbi:hypothetical protein EC9_04110 [Rosistilla ulvae]|uniref:Uncharacterized protein n=1 Tax=Rosistilla ulvae TaxID=1930277 RepID=A0A517LUF0_9BACT|nr:hypothetical protein [Rosistilla ulvae]QDS86251.1 hypothetical protein EC9_04110 [Rosistilla ulvae]